MIKKIIPMFALIFTVFLIGNNRVFAYESTINIDKTLSEYTEKFNSINGKYSNVNEYVKQFLEKSGWQKYGKYFLIDYSNASVFAFVTDDYENFNIVGYNKNNGIKNFTYHFDNSTSKCSIYFGYNSTSPYNTYNSFIWTLGNFNIDKNEENSGIITNMPSVKLYASIVNFTDTTFNPGDVFISGSDEYDAVIGENSPILSYKNSFTSNDESGDIGKVSIEFNENDKTISKYNYAQFKLQYGSNDFSEDNIPAFTHMRIFGKENSNSAWKELKIDDFKINDEYMSLEMIDKTYDYVEGSLADSTITFQLNFFETISSLYSTWKIEFYFDNTKNGYFYVFDNLNNSNWSKTKRFLEDYLFYEFPADYNYVYISSTDEVSKGKIIFPTVKIKEDYVLLNGKYYNLRTKEFGSIIEPKTYKDDNFYSYIDFEFDSSKEILALNRYQGSHSETKPYFNKKNNFDLLEVSFYALNYITAFPSNFFGTDLYFGDVEIIPSECAYFYAPIGYNVTFSTSEGSVSINTKDGYVDIDTSDTIDDSDSSDYYSNESIFKNWIKKTWNNIISPFKIINQFFDIITSLKYNIEIEDDIPGFYIDFSYFGITDEVNIINLTWYLKYRETIFNFIYLTVGSLTAVKCIKELKHIFDRGGN